MKKIYIFLFILFTTASLVACSQNTANADGAVFFYYRNSELVYNTADGVISAEIREDVKSDDPLPLLIDRYLQGPLSESQVNMIPKGVSMVGHEQTGKLFKIHLTNAFSQLKGMEQTIAGAGLAKTLMELTGAETVEIYVSGNPDDTPVMVFDQTNLLLLDECQ